VDILTKISLDKRYIAECKRLHEGRIEYKDLMQDVLLKLTLYKDSCIKAEQDGFLYAYVRRTIYSVFLNEKKRKKIMPIDIDLERLSHLQDELVDNQEHIFNDFHNVAISHELARASDLARIAVNELHKKIEDKQKGASELWSVCHSNLHSVSKDTGQTYFKLKKQIEPIIKQLKRKLDE